MIPRCAAGGRAHVADLLALPGRSDVAASLLHRAARVGWRSRNSAVECTLPRAHPLAAPLPQTGFLRRAARSEEMTLRFGVTATRTDVGRLGMLADPNGRIHVTIGDADLV